MSCGSKVALIRGDDRYENITRALELIADRVEAGLAGANRVLIKPNFVTTSRQLAATHVDAVRAVLDFLRPRYNGDIVIAEGAAMGDTWQGYRNYGYQALVDEYQVPLVDLNRDIWEEMTVYDRRLQPMKVRVARTVLQADYRISVGPPKTHDTVIVTLSLKNVVMGSLIRDVRSGEEAAWGLMRRVKDLLPGWVTHNPVYDRLKGSLVSRAMRSDKFAMHQGYHGINLNLYVLGKRLFPHLSVIDGYEAMEGNGPSAGDPVPLRVAVVSTDFLAADATAARLMGFDPDQVGYLHYCRLGGLGCMEPEVVGNATLEECARPFRPHDTYAQQQDWRIPNIEKYL